MKTTTVILIAFTIILALMGLAVWLVRRHNANVDRADTAAEDEEWSKIRAWLQSSLFSLVTIAEQSFGDGTGQLKFSAVLADVVAMLPDKWRGMVSVEVLAEFIEDALSAAKIKWLRNPALIGKDTGEDGEHED